MITIILNKQGEALNISKNPEYGYVTVQATQFVNTNGFYSKKLRTANIRGLVTDLNEMEASAGSWDNFVKGGKLITKESLTPVNAQDLSVGLKVAGDTGIICKKDGQSIYRRTEFTKNFNEMDDLIQHDNVEEIRAANNVGAANKSTADLEKEFVKQA